MTENRRETEKIYETDGLVFVFDAEVVSCRGRGDGLCGFFLPEYLPVS